MKNTSVVEDNHVTILPFMGKDVFGADGRSLHFIKEITDLFKITHGFTINDKVLDCGRVDLEVNLVGNRVFPQLIREEGE